MPRWTGSDGLADATKNNGWDDGGVQGSNAIYDSLGVMEGFNDAGVSRGLDFLAVGIDVPDAGDAGGEVLGVRFAEGDVLVAESGEEAWGVVVVFEVEWRRC